MSEIQIVGVPVIWSCAFQVGGPTTGLANIWLRFKMAQRHPVILSFVIRQRVWYIWYRGFLKWWYPQIIHFNWIFHYKPSILGYPNFWKHPYDEFFNLYVIIVSNPNGWADSMDTHRISSDAIGTQPSNGGFRK